jgi:TonB family protein
MTLRTNLCVLLVLSAISVRPQDSNSSRVNLPSPLSGTQSSVVLGRPVNEIPPKYSKHALREKIQGDVFLDLTVSGKGKVVGVAVVSGNPELAEAATKAARKWKYPPFGAREKHPVTSGMRVKFAFKIDDGNGEVATVFPATPNSSPNLFRLGPGVTPPRPIHSPDPQYTKEARKAKYQGVCVLSLIVGSDGLPRDVKVARSLERSLDQKAIEAVSQWTFEPARKNGQPVAVRINVEVQFRLY